MCTARFAFVVLTTSVVAIAACGGSTPPAQTVEKTAAAPTGDAGVPQGAGDAGPTSTTTQTLAAGAAHGTKLTPLASADGGTEAGHPKQHGELGRTLVDIRTIIASHRDDARACYDNALAAHPGIEGNLDIRWTIDPAGVVTDAELDTSHSEIVEPAVANCVIGIVKKIHFNASAKGFETKAHYPFNFHPHAHHSVGDTTQ